MPKMKWGDEDVNWQALNDEEYDPDKQFDDYEGPDPDVNTILSGDIEKLWLVVSANDDWMFKAIFKADGNEGDREQFNGLPIWDNINWSLPQCKPFWQPWLDALGLTLKDIKAKTVVEAEEDDRGWTAVTKIGDVKFPAAIRVKTSKEKKGEFKGKVTVGRYMPPAERDADDDDDEEDF